MSGEEIVLELKSPEAIYVKKGGLEIAFRVKYEFNDWIYLKSGMGYYQKNGQVEGSRIAYAVQGPFNFLQIPLALGLQPLNIDNISILNLGFETGISLNNLISSYNDNLTRGLHPDNEVDQRSNVPSFHLGVNLEIPIYRNVSFNANYQYSKDITHFFHRRYTWYNSDLGSEVFTDYDLWFKSNSISIGFLFRLLKNNRDSNPELPSTNL